MRRDWAMNVELYIGSYFVDDRSFISFSPLVQKYSGGYFDECIQVCKFSLCPRLQLGSIGHGPGLMGTQLSMLSEPLLEEFSILAKSSGSFSETICPSL